MIPLSRPSIGRLEKSFVADAVQSGWVSGTGPYVDRFEAALSARTGRAHVVAVNSGTTALEIVLAALGIGPGDEVIVPSLTFAAPAAAVLNAGATPVLCDISARDWTIDADLAASLVSSRTRAIIAVNVMGNLANFDELRKLGVTVVEDAAESHGARKGDRQAGSFGQVSIFSFHANKAISTGEGGCVLTDDEELATRVRLLVNHGMTSARPYEHDVAGRNGRMTNVTAALGAAQMERWDELIGGRLLVRDRYSGLAAGRGLLDQPHPEDAVSSCWLATFVTDADRRAKVVDQGRRAGVDVRAIWPALSNLPLYRGFAPRKCEVADAVSRTAIWLPTWHGMSDRTMSNVIDAVLGRA